MSYQVKVVYGNINSDLRDQIIDLWVRNGVLTLQEANRRVDEVVCVGYNQNNKLMGISTVYSQYVPELNGDYYFYRMFVEPKSRNRFMKRDGGDFMSETYEYFKSNSNNHKGLIAVLENTKISNQIIGEIFKFTFLGYDEKGLKVWYRNF